MVRAQGVTEAAVLGARVDQGGKAHLTDAPQALHGAGVEDAADRGVGAVETDQAVHGVAEHARLVCLHAQEN